MFASGEVESDSPLRDCKSSPSDLLVWFLVGVAIGGDAIVKVDEGLQGEARHSGCAASPRWLELGDRCSKTVL